MQTPWMAHHSGVLPMKRYILFICCIFFASHRLLSCANKDDYFNILNERITVSSAFPVLPASGIRTLGKTGFQHVDRHKGRDESRITRYLLYWGSSPAEKVAGRPVIASFSVNGNNHDYIFPPDTPVPAGATHLLIYSEGPEGETATPRAIRITDMVLQRVSDINPGSGDSNPAFLTRFSLDGKLYFSATDGGISFGNELWSYDGSAIALAGNIKSGGASSYPSSIVEYNGKLYFSANNTLTKTELMSFDGTSTMVESDIYPKGSSSPSGLVVYNGKLYFASTDGGTAVGREIWVLDSAAPPPVLALDINGGTAIPPCRNDAVFGQQ
jgi:ELWxxDGT repeat protein